MVAAAGHRSAMTSSPGEMPGTPQAAEEAEHVDASFVQVALAGAREFLGMEVAFIGEFTGGARVFRYVDSVLESCPVRPGGADPLEDSYCQRVIDGRLPQVIPDASLNPEAAALPVTHALPVGAHLSVPITLPDGGLYGTLCAFRRQPNSRLGERELGALRLLSILLAGALGRDASARAARDRAAAEVRAVIAGGFSTVFQPIVDLDSEDPVGFEALTRFPQGRPDEWFAKANRAGLAVLLEFAAFDSAVRHLTELPAGAYLAVNLSPAAVCSDELADRAAGLPLERLVIELTEQTEVTSYDELLARITWLRSLGARIAVDDAGSGYAGLQRILALAPDVLKLDVALIRGIDRDPARQAMSWAMTWFARRTGTTLVAEGIETQAELDMLISLGVRYGQGYHLRRPGPLRTLAAERVLSSRPGGNRLTRIGSKSGGDTEAPAERRTT